MKITLNLETAQIARDCIFVEMLRRKEVDSKYATKLRKMAESIDNQITQAQLINEQESSNQMFLRA
jgi:hypothetical protein